LRYAFLYIKNNPPLSGSYKKIKGVVDVFSEGSFLKGCLVVFLFLVLIISIPFVSVISIYNRLERSVVKIDQQWSQVEVVMQRRYDLVPNLVESVKGIMNHEKEIFEFVAQARSRYAGAQTQEQKIDASNELNSAISRLLMVVENYPDLKSSDAVRDLMIQLEGTENRISVERKRYNDIVAVYNLMIVKFPTRFVAQMLGHQKKTFFESDEGADIAPEVKF
jgi:LemA protein